jgi:hypothetical protein
MPKGVVKGSGINIRANAIACSPVLYVDFMAKLVPHI